MGGTDNGAYFKRRKEGRKGGRKGGRKEGKQDHEGTKAAVASASYLFGEVVLDLEGHGGDVGGWCLFIHRLLHVLLGRWS